MISYKLSIEKKNLGQVITIQPVHNLKVLQLSSISSNFHLMLTATISYCKREIIPLQRVLSAAKSKSRKVVFILEAVRTLTLLLFTDSLQTVSSIKRM